MPQISIRLTDDVYNQIKKDALKEKRSINGEINIIIEKAVKDKQNIISGNSQIDIKEIK